MLLCVSAWKNVGRETLRSNSPMAAPLFGTVFEDLKNSGSNVVFRIQPRQFGVRVEWSSPLKAVISLELHTEERIRQAGEVVVVYAGIDKGRRKPELSH